MESEYFQMSWKLKVQLLKRRVDNLIRQLTKKYRRRRGYTRFLTDEERRWLAAAEYDISTKTGIPYTM